jgi:hypothetical protein
MRYVASSDRNVYDRCIYQGVDHEADAYFITGLTRRARGAIPRSLAVDRKHRRRP